jgi:CrcB protein
MSVAGWTGLALLGGAGAVLRFVVDAEVAARTGPLMPWGIFAVNVSGAFVLGLLTGIEAGDDVLRYVGLGLLGAYTTFSTWMLQVRVMLRGGRRRAAGAYVVASLVLGFAAIAAGRGLA